MKKEIILPAARLKGKLSLEEVIHRRRSERSFVPQKLTLEQVGQLLWATQGETDKRGRLRAAPSAGALYPLEVYLLSDEGLFHYFPSGHRLEVVFEQDKRQFLAQGALFQNCITAAPVSIVICAVYERMTHKYGQRGLRYVDTEAGHAAENLHLQAVALGLSSVCVGAFDDQAVKDLLVLPSACEPLYIIPVGVRIGKNRE